MFKLVLWNLLIASIIRWPEKGTYSEPRQKGVKRKEGGRKEWCECQERRVALFLFPITAQDLIQSKGTLNGLVVLNYQDLHGNDDYLLMFTE